MKVRSLTFMRPCVVKCVARPNRCTILEFIEYHATCFGRSFRPSSGVQDCTHSIKYVSYRLADCLLAGTRWNSGGLTIQIYKRSYVCLFELMMEACHSYSTSTHLSDYTYLHNNVETVSSETSVSL
jgi:hypothetical protein